MTDVPPSALDAWFEKLRGRLLAIARERVPEADAEDVVQDALRVIHAKRLTVRDNLVDGLPPLFWCYKVLRLTVNNYYRKSGTRQRFVVAGQDPDAVPDGAGLSPVESLEAREATRAVESALRELAAASSQCGRYLSDLLGGMRAKDIAERAGVEVAVLSRRLYRCRQQLRRILAGKGIDI